MCSAHWSAASGSLRVFHAVTKLLPPIPGELEKISP